MRMLRPSCTRWAHGSGTDAHPDHTHHLYTHSMLISFSTFQMFILCTLSIRLRNWCVHWDALQELMHTLSMHVRSMHQELMCHWMHTWNLKRSLQNMMSIHIRNLYISWACASGTVALSEQMCPELMRTLSICKQFLTRMLSVKIPTLKRSFQNMMSMCVGIWCMHWAYASGTDAFTELTRPELICTLEHTNQFLSRSIKIWKGPFKKYMLSILIMYWCIPWACASGTVELAEHKWRNWCIPWAHAAVSNVYAQHKRKNSKIWKGPFKSCSAWA